MSGPPQTRGRTPAPTLRPSPAQLDAARALAAASGAGLGQGAQLLLFVHAPGAPEVHPGQGLTLHSRHGELLVDLAEHGAAGEEAGWAGINLEVTPGSYRLRSAGGPDGASEMMLTVIAGHHTQVFVPRRVTARGDVPWLQGALILLAGLGQGFHPERPDLDLTARLASALARPQGTDWKLVSDVFRASQEHPLLGLYGAHLLLEVLRAEGASRAADVLALLEAALVRCLERLGPIPDVLAVVLGLRALGALDPRALWNLEQAGSVASASQLRVWDRLEGWTSPPMFRTSWRAVVEGCIQSPRLVRSGSLPDQLAEAVLDQGPWLTWRVSGRPARVELVAEHTSGSIAAREALEDQLRWLADEEEDLSALGSRLQLSRLERRLLEHLADHSPGQPGPDAALAAEPLIRALEVPWVTVQRTVIGLRRKLASAPPGPLQPPLFDAGRGPDELRSSAG